MKFVVRLTELIEDWNHLSQRDGWGSALPTIAQELIHLPYRHIKFDILSRTLSEPLPDFQPKIGLHIREFKSTDLDAVSQIDRPSEAKSCAARLARNHIGLLAVHQGQPVGYAWTSSEIDPSLERLDFELMPGDALCVDVYTAPFFRRKGVHTALTLARFELLRELGYQRAISYIESGNVPSLTVWHKMNAQLIGHIDYKRIGPWRRARFDRFNCGIN